MSKSKKKKAKKEKELKQDFAIPPFPDFAFVIEVADKVVISEESLDVLSHPHYLFDVSTPEGCDRAFAFADEIANRKQCLVVDALNFNLDDPLIYDPEKRKISQAACTALFRDESEKIRENWKKLDAEKIARALIA